MSMCRLMIPLLPVLAASSLLAQPQVIVGDQIIRTARTFSNAEIVLHGNLIVDYNASLTLNNVKLHFAKASSGFYRIEARTGSTVNITGSTLQPDPAASGFSILMEGALLTLRNSVIAGVSSFAAPGGFTLRRMGSAVLESNTFRQWRADSGPRLVSTRNSTLRNNTFRCEGADGKPVDGCTVLYLEDSHSNTITANRFPQGYVAAALLRSSSNEISANEVTLPAGAQGINVNFGSGYNVIDNNRFSLAASGEGASAFRIENTELPNYVTGNTFTGLRVSGYLSQAGNTVVAGNTWRKGSASGFSGAPEIYRCHDIDLLNNDMEISTGVKVIQSTAIRLRGNRIRGADAAVMFLGSNVNFIERNTFAENQDDIVFLRSAGTIVERNNFSNPVRNSWDGGPNTWRDNFWAGFTAPDANGDGVADAPFPVPGGALDLTPRLAAHPEQPVAVPPIQRVVTTLPAGADEHIAENTIWENCTRQLTGSVYVSAGTTLSIRTCNVFTRSPAPVAPTIYVENGARLEAFGAKFGVDRTATGVHIHQARGGTVLVRDSQFNYSLRDPAITLLGEAATIENSEFRVCRTAIHATGPGRHTIRNNRFSDCATAAVLAADTLLQGNTITGSIATGVEMPAADRVQLTGNVIDGADISVWASNSQAGDFRGNTFRNSRLAVHLAGGGGHNFSRNNFLANGRPAYGSGWSVGAGRGNIVDGATSTRWSANIPGNYFSDYTGADANNDGMGDTPHIPDPRQPGSRDNFPSFIPYMAGSACAFDVSPTDQFLPGVLNSSSVNIRAASGCAWTAFTNDLWISITSPASGNGNGTVTFQLLANPDSFNRKGLLTVGGQSISVVQAPAGCTYSVAPDSSAPGAAGLSDRVNVTAPAVCPWNAYAGATWLRVVNGVSGAGNGAVTYQVEATTVPRIGSLSIAGRPVNVVQSAGPGVYGSGVFNAAGGPAAGIAPGSYISIYGVGIGPPTAVLAGAPAQGLGGTRVFFDNVEAYLVYAASGQVNALVPYGLTPGSRTQLVVEYGARSSPLPVPVVPADPAIFTTSGSGTGPAVAVLADGSFNSETNPAPRGTIVTFFMTGVGRTEPEIPDGVQPQPPDFPKPVLPLSFSLGGRAVPGENVVFAGLVYAGVLQVNLLIPGDAPTGAGVELLASAQTEPGKAVVSRPGVILAIR